MGETSPECTSKSGSDPIGKHDPYAADDFQWDSVTVPVTEAHPELAGSGRLQGGMLSVTASSQNPEAAFEVINYLTSDEAYIKFCAAKGSLPSGGKRLASKSGL